MVYPRFLTNSFFEALLKFFETQKALVSVTLKLSASQLDLSSKEREYAVSAVSLIVNNSDHLRELHFDDKIYDGSRWSK